MGEIQSSTIKVPKSVLEEIKVYCRKAGKPVGEWVQTAWGFIQRNDFDIYDQESTPFLMVPEKVEEERNKVDALCDVIGKILESQKELLLAPGGEISEAKEDKARAETRAEMLEKEVQRLRSKVDELEKYKEKAYRELCRVQAEQKTIGKIKVNTDL